MGKIDINRLRARSTQAVARFQAELRREDAACAKDLVLYHYTTPEGLLGIATSHVIHASDANCLNDRLELRYVSQILEDVITNLPLDGRVIDQLEQRLESRWYHVGAFIASFSEIGDCLSQWRAYAADGGGYAIGFPGDMTLRARPRGNFEIPESTAPLARVIYKESEQRTILLRLFQGLIDLLEENPTSQMDDATACQVADVLASQAGLAIAEIAPRIKHPGFEEEREWRATVRFLEQTYTGFALNFKASRYGISSAVQLECTAPSMLPICEVVLGPKLELETAARTAKYLLRQNGYNNIAQENVRPARSVPRAEEIHVWHSGVSYR